MSMMQVLTCSACMENHLNHIDKEMREGTAHACSECQKKPNKYWLENYLQPTWYERTDDGNIRLDDAGEKIVHYDIPKVLSTLSMSEKLLIRRSAPFIPSIHISSGIYEIKGHYVSFLQDISDMCDELPRRRELMVTRVHQLGKRMRLKCI